MRIAEVLEETTIPTYSKALLLTESRKTCTNLANSINQSHDALYHVFRDPIAATNEIKDKLEQVAQSALGGKKTYLVFDDSQITKPYARDIEGIDVTFDGSTGRPQLGLQLITALLTDGLVRMPVNVIPFITEQIAGAFYQSKSKLATTLLSLLVKSFTISMVLADAHYATKEFLSFLFSIKMPFLMKITRAKKVRIGKRIGQLQELLRLRRNEHVRVVRGDYDGNQCFFYVAKLENGSTVYFISLYAIDRNELIKLYRIRWNVEIYHRTAKQLLGWKDCQMRAIEKQILHSFYVMYAYAIAELVRIKMEFDSTEDAIRHLSVLKPMRQSCSINAARENFMIYA